MRACTLRVYGCVIWLQATMSRSVADSARLLPGHWQQLYDRIVSSTRGRSSQLLAEGHQQSHDSSTTQCHTKPAPTMHSRRPAPVLLSHTAGTTECSCGGRMQCTTYWRGHLSRQLSTGSPVYQRWQCSKYCKRHQLLSFHCEPQPRARQPFPSHAPGWWGGTGLSLPSAQ